jgi:hypothetical protein
VVLDSKRTNVKRPAAEHAVGSGHTDRFWQFIAASAATTEAFAAHSTTTAHTANHTRARHGGTIARVYNNTTRRREK